MTMIALMLPRRFACIHCLNVRSRTIGTAEVYKVRASLPRRQSIVGHLARSVRLVSTRAYYCQGSRALGLIRLQEGMDHIAVVGVSRMLDRR